MTLIGRHRPVAVAGLLVLLVALVLGAICGLPFPIVSMEATAARAWAADAVGGVIGAVAVLLLLSRGFMTVGLALAIPPLAAMTRVLGSRGHSWNSARP
jgi:ABC-type multidrug transport system permease subunit